MLYPHVVENEKIKICIHEMGTFDVIDKISNTTWSGDPWENSAGTLIIKNSTGNIENINISTSQKIEISSLEYSVMIHFINPKNENGEFIKGLEIITQISLCENEKDIIISIKDICAPKDISLISLEYPLRSFHLLTEEERGCGVFPFVSGVIVPSYMYPMRNSKFGIYDDSMHDNNAKGTLDVYGELGLSMPWYGIEKDKSGVLTILPDDSSVRMNYYLNYNDRQDYINKHFKESPYKRILSLYPSWIISKITKDTSVKFRIIQNSSYSKMAKEYRKEVIKMGKFLTLREKAKKVPLVNNMAGDIYIHLYGGYPHYIDYPGMAYDFDKLKEFFVDLHDNMNIKKAFVTVWGCFENYPPIHWPINEKMGGKEKLKIAFDVAKDYGYIVTPYHSWCAMLEHDKNYDENKLAKREDGTNILKDRWGTVDPALWDKIAMDILPMEIKEIGSNASYSDALQTPKLRKYLETLNIPLTQERKGNSELSVLEFHRLEGMAPHSLKSPVAPFIEVPLFNLVYHDCILTCNRWQSPDNDYDLNGDYPVRCLRNMLYGNETTYVVPYYEYDGIKKMIKQAREVMAPLHEEVAFEELVSHEALSDDYLVQQSKFTNDIVVTANLSLVDRILDNGDKISGYGYIIKHKDGNISRGSFSTEIKMVK